MAQPRVEILQTAKTTKAHRISSGSAQQHSRCGNRLHGSGCSQRTSAAQAAAAHTTLPNHPPAAALAQLRCGVQSEQPLKGISCSTAAAAAAGRRPERGCCLRFLGAQAARCSQQRRNDATVDEGNEREGNLLASEVALVRPQPCNLQGLVWATSSMLPPPCTTK